VGLIDRGPDSRGNHLVYDTELDVTWYQPTNTEMNWFAARAYAADLTIMFQGRIIDDWRLPRATDTTTGRLSPGCYVGGGDVPGNENCHGELAHLYLLLGGRSSLHGRGTDPRPYGMENPFHAFPSCKDPGCWGGGYYWLQEESCSAGPTSCGGYLIRWNNDTHGTTGATGPIYHYQTDFKFAWVVRDGDVAPR
jgi:hypothetical protein